MSRVLLFLFFLSLAAIAYTQDFNYSPGVNKRLFKFEGVGLKGEKQQVYERNYIYEYDTLQLPFIDDFSRDHFPKRVTDTNSTRVRDSLIYALYVDGQIYRDTFGFTPDSTFRYLLATNGDTISKTVNGPITINYSDLTRNRIPVYRTITVFRAYNYFDTFGTSFDSIAVAPLYTQDSNKYFIVSQNANDFYTNRQAYLNTTFGLNPPSIGVVTFDGLNEFGYPYDFDMDLRVLADSMNSVPIDLSNLPDTNVYFSFYYQPKGLAIDKPEREDSLVLDFYNPTTNTWGSAWDTTGFKSDIFRQVIIKVPNTLHQKGFQFRFKNYGNSTGAFDQWHIDYLYLNNGRSNGDTIRKDIAYVYDAPSLLKDYYAMPFFHFRNNPARYMADSAYPIMNNLSNEQLPIFNFLNVPDTTAAPGTDFYQYPVGNSNFITIPKDTQIVFLYPLDFSFPVNKVISSGTFKSPFSIDFRPAPTQEQDFIRSNDTIIAKTVLENYYAYDDGTAEAGYGVNPDLDTDGRTAYVSVQFKIPFKDTLQGILTYFLPQTVNITKQTFILSVWSNLNPTNLLYQDTMASNPAYSDDNGFVGYSLDSALVVDTNFYIGIKSIGLNSLNMGYDLNTNNRDKIFWSQNGENWFNPSNGIFDGSLMLRPVFRDRVFDVGINKTFVSAPARFGSIKVFPNPTKNQLFVEINHNEKIHSIQMFDLSSRLISEINPYAIQQASIRNSEGYTSKMGVDVTSLISGVYLLKFTDEKGLVQTQKFMVNK